MPGSYGIVFVITLMFASVLGMQSSSANSTIYYYRDITRVDGDVGVYTKRCSNCAEVNICGYYVWTARHAWERAVGRLRQGHRYELMRRSGSKYTLMCKFTISDVN